MHWGIIKEPEIPVAILCLKLISVPQLYCHIGGKGVSVCLKKRKDWAGSATEFTSVCSFILFLPFNAIRFWTLNLKIKNTCQKRKIHHKCPVRLYGISIDFIPFMTHPSVIQISLIYK